MSRLKLIGLALTACALVLMRPVPGAAISETSDEYSFKIQVESHLEQHLKSVLTDIAGSDDIIVIVNAEVETDKKNKSSKKRKKPQGLVLPGVPVKKEIGKTADEGIIISSVVRRLEVRILVDNDIPESLTELAHDIAISVIGYDPDRGDMLTIKRIEFGNKGFKWASLFYPPHLYWLVTLIVGGFFLVAAAMFFMDPFKKLPPAMGNVNWDVILKNPDNPVFGRGMAGAPTAALTARAETVAGGDAPLPFSFINDVHIPELAFLLSKNPAGDIAIVANYLRPDLSVMLLESFPPEIQAEVVLKLKDTAEADPEQVKALEESVKERLDYVVGGDDKLASVLNLAEGEVRDKVLQKLEEEDPQASARLRPKLKTFESMLRSMKPHALQALFRQLDATVLARVLKSSSADIQTRVLESLSEGAAELLREEMELSRPLSAVRLKKEKHSIAATVLRLASAGVIEEEDI